MKKFLLFVLAAVVLLGFVVPQFFLSPSYAMDRALQIEAPADEVHRTLADLTTWDSWTVWNSEVDPTLERKFEGTAGAPGHRMSWTGEKLGNGSLELTKVEPNRIEYTFQAEGWDPSVGAFDLASSGDSSTGVTWAMSGEITGMPAKRYFGLMMDSMVGPDFEGGLQGLKTKLESSSDGGE